MNPGVKKNVSFGPEGGRHVAIELIDKDSAGRYLARVSAAASPWRGAVCGHFHQGELRRFAADLERLSEKPEGEATLEPKGRVLRIKLVGDGNGQVRAKVLVQQSEVDDARLEFTLWLDHSELSLIAARLRAMDAG